MTNESAAFLNALVPVGGAASTDYTDEIYALLEPVHGVLEKVEVHLTAIDRLRRLADAAEMDPTIYGWFERFKQTIDATRTRMQDAKRSLEAISDVCFQLDTYAREMRTVLAQKPEIPNAPLRVNLTRVEHDALVATAAEANARLAEALAKLEVLEAAK